MARKIKARKVTGGQKIHIYALVLVLVLVLGILTVENVSQNLTGHAKGGGKPGGGSPPAANVTRYIELLGNPAMSQYPNNPTARTPWDMQIFNNKVYLGIGDFNTNTGTNVEKPGVWAYDISTEQFVREYTVDEEAIVTYKILGDMLAIPGIDPLVWDGHVYFLKNGTWSASGRITNVYHINDVEKSADLFFTAQNPLQNVSAVKASAGLCCTNWGAVIELISTSGSWVTPAFFLMNSTIYAQVFKGTNSRAEYYEHAGGTSFKPVSASMVPKSSGKYMDPRIVYYKGKMVYMTNPSWSHGGGPASAVVIASTLTNAYKTGIPSTDQIWDLIKATDKNGIETVYVLTSTYSSARPFVSKVYKSTDLKAWAPIFQFETASNYIKSFESYNGDFYFGTGGGTSAGNKSIGNVLRLKSEFVP